jgi:hypothetical protein
VEGLGLYRTANRGISDSEWELPVINYFIGNKGVDGMEMAKCNKMYISVTYGTPA